MKPLTTVVGLLGLLPLFVPTAWADEQPAASAAVPAAPSGPLTPVHREAGPAPDEAAPGSAPQAETPAAETTPPKPSSAAQTPAPTLPPAPPRSAPSSNAAAAAAAAPPKPDSQAVAARPAAPAPRPKRPVAANRRPRPTSRETAAQEERAYPASEPLAMQPRNGSESGLSSPQGAARSGEPQPYAYSPPNPLNPPGYGSPAYPYRAGPSYGYPAAPYAYRPEPGYGPYPGWQRDQDYRPTPFAPTYGADAPYGYSSAPEYGGYQGPTPFRGYAMDMPPAPAYSYGYTMPGYYYRGGPLPPSPW